MSASWLTRAWDITCESHQYFHQSVSFPAVLFKDTKMCCIFTFFRLTCPKHSRDELVRTIMRWTVIKYVLSVNVPGMKWLLTNVKRFSLNKWYKSSNAGPSAWTTLLNLSMRLKKIHLCLLTYSSTLMMQKPSDNDLNTLMYTHTVVLCFYFWPICYICR